MTQTATSPGADIRPVARTSRFRPWIALAAAAVVFAVGLLGVLPFILALPVIGVMLALGSPPDHVADTRPIARRPRNAVIGSRAGSRTGRGDLAATAEPAPGHPVRTGWVRVGGHLPGSCCAGPALGDGGCKARQTADWLVPADPAQPDPVPHHLRGRGRLVRRARSEPPTDRGPGAHLAADHRAQPDQSPPGANGSNTASYADRSAPDSDRSGCNWPTWCCSAPCWPSPSTPGPTTP